MTPRHAVLAVALVATFVAVWMVSDGGVGDGESVVPAVPRRAAPVKAAALPAAKVSAPEDVAVRFAASGPDLFPPQSWKPPPAPPPAQLPPPPPQAPSLPFKYVGRWDAGDGEAIFLAEGDRVVSVHVGQKLAQWRLDSVDAGGMNFTYLPLQQQRQLRFGP